MGVAGALATGSAAYVHDELFGTFVTGEDVPPGPYAEAVVDQALADQALREASSHQLHRLHRPIMAHTSLMARSLILFCSGPTSAVSRPAGPAAAVDQLPAQARLQSTPTLNPTLLLGSSKALPSDLSLVSVVARSSAAPCLARSDLPSSDLPSAAAALPCCPAQHTVSVPLLMPLSLRVPLLQGRMSTLTKIQLSAIFLPAPLNPCRSPAMEDACWRPGRGPSLRPPPDVITQDYALSRAIMRAIMRGLELSLLSREELGVDNGVIDNAVLGAKDVLS